MSRENALLIAVDGPAASGKGTLARRLAKHFGLHYLDTGSLYRAVAWRVLASGGEISDQERAIAAAKTMTPSDLNQPELRDEIIGQGASVISAIPEVRDALLAFQRHIAHLPEGAVLDGRDIGTVVCPDAPYKFFITASIEARAKRRFQELASYGINQTYEQVYSDLEARDNRDKERSVAPLVPASDAVVVDTTSMDAESVFSHVISLIKVPEHEPTSSW